MISVISLSMTEKTKEKKELEQVPYIWYSVIVKVQTEALLDSRNKVNIVSQAFVH